MFLNNAKIASYYVNSLGLVLFFKNTLSYSFNYGKYYSHSFNRKQKSRVKVRSPFAFATLYGFDGMTVKNI
jgi:hypothetical protein